MTKQLEKARQGLININTCVTVATGLQEALTAQLRELDAKREELTKRKDFYGEDVGTALAALAAEREALNRQIDEVGAEIADLHDRRLRVRAEIARLEIEKWQADGVALGQALEAAHASYTETAKAFFAATAEYTKLECQLWALDADLKRRGSCLPNAVRHPRRILGPKDLSHIVKVLCEAGEDNMRQALAKALERPAD